MQPFLVPRFAFHIRVPAAQRNSKRNQRQHSICNGRGAVQGAVLQVFSEFVLFFKEETAAPIWFSVYAASSLSNNSHRRHLEDLEHQ